MTEKKYEIVKFLRKGVCQIVHSHAEILLRTPFILNETRWTYDELITQLEVY